MRRKEESWKATRRREKERRGRKESGECRASWGSERREECDRKDEGKETHIRAKGISERNGGKAKER